MKLKILATSDVHGYLYPTDYFSEDEEMPLGLFKLASLIEQERKEENANILLIENGDFIQGSPMSQYIKEHDNVPDRLMSALNELHYDVGVLGNHEFNYGLDYLKQAIRQVNHPVLSANILTSEKDYLADAPYQIIEKAGIKIGVLGLTTQYIPHWEHPEHIGDLEFISAVETAKKWVPLLKEQADLVVVSYHGGFEADLATGAPTEKLTGENEGYELLHEVEGIDVLITGHQHRQIAGILKGVPVIQPGFRGEKIGKIELTLAKDGNQVQIVDQRVELLSAGDAVAARDLVNRYTPLEQEVVEWLDEVIGYTEMDLRMTDPFQARLVKHPYVQLINQVQLDYTDADISCTALFSNQVRGYGKTITNRDVLLNYPYPNTLAVIQVSVEELKAALEQTAGYFSINDQNEITVSYSYLEPKELHYNYDMYEGIDYVLDISKPEGQRVVQLTFQGQPVKPTDTFKLVTNQYRAIGGGNFSMFENKPFLEEVKKPMNDLLREYISEQKIIDFKLNRNFKVVNGNN